MSGQLYNIFISITIYGSDGNVFKVLEFSATGNAESDPRKNPKSLGSSL